MRVLIYDIEIYVNFFCVCTKDYETGERKTFVWSLIVDEILSFEEFLAKGARLEYTDDDRYELMDYIEDSILVGYNNKSFDDPILERCTLMNDIRTLHQYAQERIANSKPWNVPQTKLFSIDLMTLVFNEAPRSLKLVGTNLNHPRLQELPIHYMSVINKEQADILIDYCHNDVDITERVYAYNLGQIKQRAEVGGKYMNDAGVFISDAESVMADKLMRKFWQDGGNTIPSRDEIPKFGSILIDNIIDHKVEFNSEHLSSILSELRKDIITVDTKFRLDIELAQIHHIVAKGGIHGCPKNLIVEASDEYVIIDADISSMYPMSMLNMLVFPPQLGVGFLDKLRDIVVERLGHKAAKRFLESYALKILINSVYGKMGKEGHWLSSLSGMYKVTINGQLFILMLVERLLDVGIWVFYSNTDGITVLCKKTQVAEYYRICKEWEEYTQYELEYVDYQKCILKDVNNYIIQKVDGGLKAKGNVLNPENHLDSLKKSLHIPACATAITEFFINDIPVSETLKKVYNETDNDEGIYQFCFAAKVSREFEVVYETVTRKMHSPISEKTQKLLKERMIVEIHGEEIVQNSIRYYIAKSGKRIRKRRIGGEKGTIGEMKEMISGYDTQIFNDYTTDRLEPNWQYYEDRCYNIIQEFKKVKV